MKIKKIDEGWTPFVLAIEWCNGLLRQRCVSGMKVRTDSRSLKHGTYQQCWAAVMNLFQWEKS